MFLLIFENEKQRIPKVPFLLEDTRQENQGKKQLTEKKENVVDRGNWASFLSVEN